VEGKKWHRGKSYESAYRKFYALSNKLNGLELVIHGCTLKLKFGFTLHLFFTMTEIGLGVILQYL